MDNEEIYNLPEGTKIIKETELVELNQRDLELLLLSAGLRGLTKLSLDEFLTVEQLQRVKDIVASLESQSVQSESLLQLLEGK